MATKVYAVELTSENFDKITDYLIDDTDMPISELKITDYVVLTQNVARRYRQWTVLSSEKFNETFEFNNQASYLYFRGVNHL